MMRRNIIIGISSIVILAIVILAGYLLADKYLFTFEYSDTNDRGTEISRYIKREKGKTVYSKRTSMPSDENFSKLSNKLKKSVAELTKFVEKKDTSETINLYDKDKMLAKLYLQDITFANNARIINTIYAGKTNIITHIKIVNVYKKVYKLPKEERREYLKKYPIIYK